MQQRAHRVADSIRYFVGAFSAAPTKSQFITQGTLTPNEFVDAGDQLVFKFPTWHWQSGEGNRSDSWLPEDKQFLITRSVPCRRRVKDLDSTAQVGSTEENDWAIPGPKTEEGQSVESIRESLDEEFDSADATCLQTLSRNSEYRLYDLTITYDRYYRTPRIWLCGYNEAKDHEPLTPNEIFEDVLSHYVSKTVTVDPHPFTGILTASIHPCRHAEMMKRVVSGWLERKIPVRHDLALIVLLKFISCVVPTIEYDFTTGVEMI